jgi:hypothetical protein
LQLRKGRISPKFEGFLWQKPKALHINLTQFRQHDAKQFCVADLGGTLAKTRRQRKQCYGLKLVNF